MTMFPRPVLHSCVLLSLLGGLSSVTGFASEKDAVSPAELRAEAKRLEGFAVELILHGTEEQVSTAKSFKRLAESHRQEAELREEGQELLDQAQELESAGKDEEAKQRRMQSAEKLVQAEALIAERTARQRLESRAEDFRDELKVSLSKAAVLRQQGRFAEAEVLEAEVKKKLREAGYDGSLRRANELKQRAVQARLEGRYADADLFQREAERLLNTEDASSSDRERTTGLGAGGRSDEQELRSLREDVHRLSQQVRRLSEAVEILSQQNLP